MTDDALSQRKEFRQAAINLRELITDRQSKSRRMQQYLCDYLDSNLPRWICCYVDKDPEPATQALVRRWCDDPKIRLAVPVCDRNILRLFHLEDFNQLSQSQFGLLEPAKELWTSDRMIDPKVIDLFIVPGVAFDRSLNRMGYGKGYYDRMLASSRQDSQKVGYCFDQQIVDALPCVQTWDYPMSQLLTESGWLEFGR